MGKIITNKIVLIEGKKRDSWPIDKAPDGCRESNGSQEFLVEYKGKFYLVWVTWSQDCVEPYKAAIKYNVEDYLDISN